MLFETNKITVHKQEYINPNDDKLTASFINDDGAYLISFSPNL